jgi:hypothetical protein
MDEWEDPAENSSVVQHSPHFEPRSYRADRRRPTS